MVRYAISINSADEKQPTQSNYSLQLPSVPQLIQNGALEWTPARFSAPRMGVISLRIKVEKFVRYHMTIDLGGFRIFFPAKYMQAREALSL